MVAQKRASLDTIGNKRLLGQNKTKKAYEKKRAAKAITKAVMYRLFGLDSPINEDYRQAYMCNEYLFQNGDKITSNYCQKKCCTVCNRIRGAQHLAKYGGRILELGELYLVTLTNKNVHQGELYDEVNGMYAALTRMKKNIYKTYKTRINGYRTFECTYRGFKTGFNPHFHFIVQGEKEANLLVKLWLKQFPSANVGGQNVKKVTNTKKSLLEVFKYLAKPITKGYYSATAYDEIMIAAKRHRVTEPLGCIRGKKDEDSDELSLEELKAQKINFKGHRVEVWKYVHELYDYVSPDGELLLDTKLDAKTINSLRIIERYDVEEKKEKMSEQSMFYEHRGKGKILF